MKTSQPPIAPAFLRSVWSVPRFVTFALALLAFCCGAFAQAPWTFYTSTDPGRVGHSFDVVDGQGNSVGTVASGGFTENSASPNDPRHTRLELSPQPNAADPYRIRDLTAGDVWTLSAADAQYGGEYGSPPTGAVFQPGAGTPPRVWLIAPPARTGSLALIQVSPSGVVSSYGVTVGGEVLGGSDREASATFDPAAGAFWIVDLIAHEIAQQGAQDLGRVSWTPDYASYPQVGASVFVAACEVGHKFTVYYRADGGPQFALSATAVASGDAGWYGSVTDYFGNSFEVPGAVVSFAVGEGMRFSVTRDADAVATPIWTADSAGGPALVWNAAAIFLDPPYRSTVPVTFRVNNDTRGTHEFSVRQSDGYIMSWFTPSHGTGSIDSWDDQGVSNALAIALLPAPVDPAKSWWLRDETLGEDLPVGQTDVLDGWTPMHSDPPPTPILTIRLPVWLDPGYISISPSPHDYGATLGEFPATGPSLATYPGVDSMANYSIPGITITIENQHPYNTSFTLSDGLTGQARTFQGANGDMSHWFGPTQALALSISGSRWDHRLVVRHPNGDAYPITQHQTQGGTWFDPNGGGWQVSGFYFDATADHHAELPWYVEDRTTHERSAPANATNLINWKAVIRPTALTATGPSGDSFTLHWQSNDANPGGGYQIERAFPDSGFALLRTVAAADVLDASGDFATMETGPLTPGIPTRFRVRYIYGGVHSAPSNAVSLFIPDPNNPDPGDPPGGDPGDPGDPGNPGPGDGDSDDDGTSDGEEGGGDTDGDHYPDYLDTDSDNDGIGDDLDAHPKDARRHADIPKLRYASIDLLPGENLTTYERYTLLSAIDDNNQVGLYVPGYPNARAGTWQNGALTLRPIALDERTSEGHPERYRVIYAVNSSGTVGGYEWKKYTGGAGNPNGDAHGYRNPGGSISPPSDDISFSCITCLANSGSYAGNYRENNHAGYFSDSTFIHSVTDWDDEEREPEHGSLVHWFALEGTGCRIAADGTVLGRYYAWNYHVSFGPMQYALLNTALTPLGLPPTMEVMDMNAAGTMLLQEWGIANGNQIWGEPFLSTGQSLRSMLPPEYAGQIGQLYPQQITDGDPGEEVIIFMAEILNPDPSGPEWTYARLLLDPTTTPPTLRDITNEVGYGEFNSNWLAAANGYLSFPAEIRIMKPDADWWGETLPEEQAILFNEKLRFRIEVSMYFETAQQMIDALQLSPLKLTTLGPDGQISSYPITANNTEFISSADGNWSHLRVLITWQQLQQLGMLPGTDDDGVLEMAWYDTGADNSSSDSNLDDGRAFEAGLNYSRRGRCTRAGTLRSDPPNSPLSKTFLKSGGVRYFTIDAGGISSERCQIANQADIFYFSGHGHHSNAELDSGVDMRVSPLANVQGLGFGPAEAAWTKDIDIAILAGCSVLDIKDFRAKSFAWDSYVWYLANGGAWSPGALWESTGPKYFLGYCWSAPLDSQGSAGIITSFLNGMNSGIINAWKNANNPAVTPAAINACAIDTTVTPHEYWYWDETSGTPIWTKKVKGASGW